MYKRPITPCDIDHRYLFSKVEDVEEKVEMGRPTMDCILNDKTEALPAAKVHDAECITGPCREVNLEPSRFTSKEMPQVYTSDPTNALLNIRYGYKSTPKLMTPNWFANVMVKLSGNVASKSDPSSLLLSLRHGKQTITSLKTPGWLATAMLNLSSPPAVTSCYPLPSKVQLSLLARDCQVAITRLKALNISVSPTLPIAVTTSPVPYSFFPPHVNRKSKNYSNLSDTRYTVPQLNYVRAPSARRVAKV